jgi:hypothetical protein
MCAWRRRTKFNIRQTESLGCAPTPSQYFALDRSSETSLYGLALRAASSERFVGRCGRGFSVPITSRGFESRALLLPQGLSQSIFLYFFLRRTSA